MKRFDSFNESKDQSTEAKGFKDNIEKDTVDNMDFRKALYTGKHLQLVLMSLKPGEDIGMESHKSDQFFRFEKGNGKCIINGHEYDVAAGDAVVVPGGAKHNVINTSKKELKLYVVYGPPNHDDDTVRKTKEEAEDPDKAERFTGKTTE